MAVIQVKIIGIRPAQRYCIRRAVIAAEDEIRRGSPEFQLILSEIKDMQEIQRYTPVLASAVLWIDGKIVCTGRIPSKQEVAAWLLAACDSPADAERF